MPPPSPGQRRDPSGGDERRRVLHTGRDPKGLRQVERMAPDDDVAASAGEHGSTVWHALVCQARDGLSATPKNADRELTREQCHHAARAPHGRVYVWRSATRPSAGPSPWRDPTRARNRAPTDPNPQPRNRQRMRSPSPAKPNHQEGETPQHSKTKSPPCGERLADIYRNDGGSEARG